MFRGGEGLSEICQPTGWIPDVDQESRQKSKRGENLVPYISSDPVRPC